MLLPYTHCSVFFAILLCALSPSHKRWQAMLLPPQVWRWRKW